jgi:hypothetical protein
MPPASSKTGEALLAQEFNYQSHPWPGSSCARARMSRVKATGTMEVHAADFAGGPVGLDLRKVQSARFESIQSALTADEMEVSGLTPNRRAASVPERLRLPPSQPALSGPMRELPCMLAPSPARI